MRRHLLSESRPPFGVWRLCPSLTVLGRTGLGSRKASPGRVFLNEAETSFHFVWEGRSFLFQALPFGLSLLGYAFLPIPFLVIVIRKARIDQASIILVAPKWLTQPWSPDHLGLTHVPPIKLHKGPRSLLRLRTSDPRLASMRDSLNSLGASSHTLSWCKSMTGQAPRTSTLLSGTSG